MLKAMLLSLSLITTALVAMSDSDDEAGYVGDIDDELATEPLSKQRPSKAKKITRPGAAPSVFVTLLLPVDADEASRHTPRREQSTLGTIPETGIEEEEEGSTEKTD